mmetsp:Transcript_26396/g.40647  ORF Transcript_26396/g.40647 Transcript_26396/m.40647 type:complete len:93 (-) Transcript_26396:84-362(-)
MTGATIKTRMHAMPAPTVLLETTLLLNVLSENHQGTAAKSTSSHDAVESSIIELGFIGCIAEGKAGATSYAEAASTTDVSIGAVATAYSISV